MASWGDFEAQAPALAAFDGAERLTAAAAYLATLRRARTPRVHPVSPIVGGGRLFVFMEPTSPRPMICGSRRTVHAPQRRAGHIRDGWGILRSGPGHAAGRPRTAHARQRCGSLPPRRARYLLFELLVDEARCNGYGRTCCCPTRVAGALSPVELQRRDGVGTRVRGVGLEADVVLTRPPRASADSRGLTPVSGKEGPGTGWAAAQGRPVGASRTMGRVPPASDAASPSGRGRRRAISIEEIEDAVVDGGAPAPARAVPHGRPCRTGPSASSSWAPSPRTSAPGCGTSSSVRSPPTSRTRPLSSASSSSPSSADPRPAHGRRPPGGQDRPRALPDHPLLEQLVFSLGVALVAASPHPSHVLLMIMVLGVGAGSAMFGPAYSASCPVLVGRRTCPAPSR